MRNGRQQMDEFKLEVLLILKLLAEAVNNLSPHSPTSSYKSEEAYIRVKKLRKSIKGKD